MTNPYDHNANYKLHTQAGNFMKEESQNYQLLRYHLLPWEEGYLWPGRCATGSQPLLACRLENGENSWAPLGSHFGGKE